MCVGGGGVITHHEGNKEENEGYSRVKDKEDETKVNGEHDRLKQKRRKTAN